MSFTHDRVYVRKYGTNTPLLYISHHHPCIQALHPSKPLSQVTAISCHSSLFSYQTNTHFFQFTNTIHSITFFSFALTPTLTITNSITSLTRKPGIPKFKQLAPLSNNAKTHTSPYLAMLIGERLIRLYNLMQIGVHQFVHNINIVEILPLRWPNYVLYFNYLHKNGPNQTKKKMHKSLIVNSTNKRIRKNKAHVIMFHVTEKLDFPERPLGVDPVVKGIPNLLYRHSFFRLRIRRTAKQSS